MDIAMENLVALLDAVNREQQYIKEEDAEQEDYEDADEHYESDEDEMREREQEQQRTKPLWERIFQVFGTLFGATCALASYAEELMRRAFLGEGLLLKWTWWWAPVALLAAIGASKHFGSPHIAALLEHPEVAAAGEEPGQRRDRGRG